MQDRLIVMYTADVARGTITPDLPTTKGDETETATNNAFILSADTRDHNTW
ncbi:MAG: hypothetical protein ACI3YC_09165 [Alloprevotella sp.]